MIIRELEMEEIPAFTHIADLAFPSLNTSNWLQNHLMNTTGESLYGFFDQSTLFGGMRCFDFKLNVNGNYLPAGGLGLLAVDLLHKKEKIAKQLVEYFFQYYDENNTSIVMLYPFNVSFYKKMGFGLGSKVWQYQLPPQAFHQEGTKQKLHFLTKDEAGQVLCCYNRYHLKTHGTTRREDCASERERPFRLGNVIGYSENGTLLGYMSFHLKDQSLYIEELIYENSFVFGAFSSFLHSQTDQINNIITNTQEENFPFLLNDPFSNSTNMDDNLISHPLETSVAGIGVMYRIINVKRFFRQVSMHDFNNQDISVKLNICDDFYQANNTGVIVSFENGYPHIGDESYDVELSLDISVFSSLVMGVVTLKELVNLGLAQVDVESYLPVLERVFHTSEKPICIKAF